MKLVIIEILGGVATVVGLPPTCEVLLVDYDENRRSVYCNEQGEIVLKSTEELNEMKEGEYES